MPHHLSLLYQWQDQLGRRFASLSAPQIKGLAQWSYGMVLSGSCSLAAVSAQLSALLGQPVETTKKRLREWYAPQEKKKGAKRKELAVAPCQQELLAWLLEGWPDQKIAFALDATSLSDRLVVLAVSVLYGGFAIPVAWRITKANRKGAWKPLWQEMLRQLAEGMPEGLEVFVLADRGLYAPWLFEQIKGSGWHPLLRINAQGWFCPEGQQDFLSLSQLAARLGESCCYQGTAFKGKKTQLKECVLLSAWQEGQEEPWLILTDKPSQEIGTYALRNWIEQGFKHTKRDGWQWHKSRMLDPARAERIWLAMAVAFLWLAKMGGQSEAKQKAKPQAKPKGNQAGQTRPQDRRTMSLFRRGLAEVRALMMTHRRYQNGRWYYQPWPNFEPQAAPSRSPPAA